MMLVYTHLEGLADGIKVLELVVDEELVESLVGKVGLTARREFGVQGRGALAYAVSLC
jgi:hypothetical protein